MTDRISLSEAQMVESGELIDWRRALFEDALESIAASTCCNRCQEAALVARGALRRAKQG